MSDEIFDGLDDPRELPEALRARIEHAIVSGEEAAGAERASIAGIDAPRRMPPPLEAKVEKALGASALFEAIDTPRPLPAPVRARIESALARDTVRAPAAIVQRALAIAASFVLILASTLVAVRDGPDGTPPREDLAIPLPSKTLPAPDPERSTDPVPPIFPPLATLDTPGQPSFGGATPAFGSGAPPFAHGSGALVGPGEAGPRTQRAPVRIGVVRGDPAIEAGFDAYVRVLNASGGAGGSRMVLLDVTDGEPQRNTIGTVNLSAAAIAEADGPPNWATGPLFESLATPDAFLRGTVFGFSSAVDRQGHLIADAVFPARVDAASAVIYTGGGVFADVVPDAIEEVLRSRNVTVARVEYDPARPFVRVPADAAFLSMDAEMTRAWILAADEGAYGAVGSVYPFTEPAVFRESVDGVAAVSPYQLDAFEGRHVARLAKRDVSASVIHGWVTAKMLAVAIWRTGADSAKELTDAMDGLAGFQNGFTPPYSERSGTNSRAPEGVIYEVREGTLVAQTGFITDPR